MRILTRFTVGFLPRQRSAITRSSSARRAVISGVISLVILTLVLSYSMEGRFTRFRDPEYAARRDRLLARQAERPTRPAILVLGSSRAVEGIRPDAINGDTGPYLLNGGLVGSGSMLELMEYRRLKAAGFTPSAVLLEYWPPLLRGDNHAEFGRINLPRLSPHDLPIVWDYFPDPSSVTRYVIEGQLWPAWRYRRQFLSDVRPKWVPEAKHDMRFAAGIDEWGWWPGCRDEDADAERAKRSDATKNPFKPYLDGYSVGREADRALRDLLRECRSDGVPVAFVALPEGAKYRSLYSENAKWLANEHLKGLIDEFHISLFDARLFDEFAVDLPDDIHLTQGGAARFTNRLREHLPRLFPSLYRDPSTPVVP